MGSVATGSGRLSRCKGSYEMRRTDKWGMIGSHGFEGHDKCSRSSGFGIFLPRLNPFSLKDVHSMYSRCIVPQIRITYVSSSHREMIAGG